MYLPQELLVHIFKKLTAQERNVASETCRYWYLTANDYSFNKRKFITCDILPCSEDTGNPIQTFLNSLVIYYNYRFYMLSMSDMVNDFWVQLGGKLRTLKINNSKLHYMDVIVILNSCTELEALSLLSCEFVRQQRPTTTTNDKSHSELRNLKSLDLSKSNVYDALFDILVKHSPGIEKLNLADCELKLHSKLDNNEDILTDAETPSIVHFTFGYVLGFIKSRSKKIKHLVLPEVDDAFIMSLTKLEDLFLESFEFSCPCNIITEEVISVFIKRQVSLKKLDLSCMFSDKSILDICQYLTDLESLNMIFCTDLTDYGISELHKLKKLKSLCFPLSQFVTNKGIKRSLNKQRNVYLKELGLPSFENLVESNLIGILQLFPNLKYLDLCYCEKAVTDKSLQTIFKYQTQLEVLSLNGCNKLYYLGACDLDNDKTKPGLYSLKKLRELVLGDCSNIKSECIKRSFHLPSLVKLNLSSCSNITDENIKSVVQNCPNIEHLNLSNCKKLTNEIVEIIGTSLKYLKSLNIDHCDITIEKGAKLSKMVYANRRMEKTNK